MKTTFIVRKSLDKKFIVIEKRNAREKAKIVYKSVLPASVKAALNKEVAHMREIGFSVTVKNELGYAL